MFKTKDFLYLRSKLDVFRTSNAAGRKLIKEEIAKLATERNELRQYYHNGWYDSIREIKQYFFELNITSSEQDESYKELENFTFLNLARSIKSLGAANVREAWLYFCYWSDTIEKNDALKAFALSKILSLKYTMFPFFKNPDDYVSPFYIELISILKADYATKHPKQ